ncbi:BMP family ABC transporter substrate-binding protein [Rhizobium rhizosphaerae]|uniref:BMP family ABC transporter substrate-binding protein n=1 Tax=Xaviernesmea rhizosphaerae TaxID=1672749 RepID=A0ABX3PD44_9HYPH|nr:BMP family ABC transporter substrate-binding protein [Xaviernesmea rhizosphaerae]OQP86381.1 BMP family ABC transporter substrate-binding protein [Xaviernesmea rhizosphaerae]
MTEIHDAISSSPNGLRRRDFMKGAAVAVAGIGLLPQLALAQGAIVALVHTQAAGDNGPVDSMIAKLNAIAAEKGFTPRIVYASDAATYETIFRTLGDAGAAVIVSTFNEVAEAFKALAPEYPDTKWIQLFGDPIEPSLPNVVTVSYDYYLGCYLSGLFGAMMSPSGKLGYIGGISLPPLNADANAIKAAMTTVKPDATLTVAFAGSFQDPAKGQEIATQMYKNGVDYIQTDSAATDAGIIAAANEIPGKLVSGISPAQYKLGPKSVAAIVSLDFGQSLYNEVAATLKLGWKGGHTKTGLGTGVIDFILSPVFVEQGDPALVAKAKEVWPKIEEARARILDGSLAVPFNTAL